MDARTGPCARDRECARAGEGERPNTSTRCVSAGAQRRLMLVQVSRIGVDQSWAVKRGHTDVEKRESAVLCQSQFAAAGLASWARWAPRRALLTPILSTKA